MMISRRSGRANPALLLVLHRVILLIPVIAFLVIPRRRYAVADESRWGGVTEAL